MHWGSCVCTARTQCEMKHGLKVSRNLVSKIGFQKAKTILQPHCWPVSELDLEF